MSGWADLRQRLDAHDRRVYAFVHPCLPGEPLVVLHTALMQQAAESVRGLVVHGGGWGTAEEEEEQGSPRGNQDLVRLPDRLSAQQQQQPQPLPPKVAVFYSISSTQPGLAGVDLGHLLIKRAAEKVMVSCRVNVPLSPVDLASGHSLPALSALNACEPSSLVQCCHWSPFIAPPPLHPQAEFPSVQLLVTLPPPPCTCRPSSPQCSC